VHVDLELEDTPEPLTPEVELALFRIAQEALTNSGRHADATSAHLTLTFRDSCARLSVADNGKGFDRQGVSPPSTQGGLGLYSMQERAALLGASLDIASNAWNTRDKWIGTLLPPGGYFTVLFVGFGSFAARTERGCSSGSNFVNGHRVTYSPCGPSTPTWEGVLFGPAGIVILLLPLLTTIYLGIQLHRATALNNPDVSYGGLAAH